MTKRRPVLIVEDSDDDFNCMMWAWEKAGIQAPVARCSDGEQALDRLFRRGKYAELREFEIPALVILDLNLPRTPGRAVLATIKQHCELKAIPVIILTTSANPRDVVDCYRNGASSYVLKPNRLSQFREILEKTVEYWTQVVFLPPPASEVYE